MNIIERIREAMDDDDDNLDKQSAILLRDYDAADAAGKQLLDDALVCICGWSLETLRANKQIRIGKEMPRG
jgi:hypothetical protein